MASRTFVLGTPSAPEARRLKSLENENGKLAELIAERRNAYHPGHGQRKPTIPFDIVICALRNCIERCFAKLKCPRRLAAR